MSRLLLLLGVLAAVFPAPAFAAGRVECSALDSAALKQKVRYCALLPPSYDQNKAARYPVLYHLHGLGGDEQTFVSLGGWSVVEQMQAAGEIGEFIIVMPQGGRSFYINSRDGQIRYEDFFIQEFLPAVEKRYRVRPGRANRGIHGISMGGYGALRMAFKYPHLFGSVAAHSAALMAKLPEGIGTSGGGPGARVLGDVFGRPVDRNFYAANNPIALARTAKLAGLKIYFDCGLQDDFGFDAGARELNQALKQRGVAHEFHLYPGVHGWDYVAEHLDASLTFHSRAFGLKGAGQQAQSVR
jgi:S-formylglutathione hydrolase FrmB